MPERWKSDAASWLNCSLMSIPFTYLGIPIGMSLKQLLHAMKHRHRHGYRTRHGHGHGHVDTCNVQNIERSTSVVSDTDTDACRTPDTGHDKGLGCPCFIDYMYLPSLKTSSMSENFLGITMFSLNFILIIVL